MKRAGVYLDHNASAALLPEAGAALLEVLEMTGNPSSVHGHGRELANCLEQGRRALAGAAGAEPGQVVFTGSATEAIAQAIIGGARTFGVNRVAVAPTEHAAVLRAAEATGLPVDLLPVDSDGVIRLEALRALVGSADAAGETLLVAVGWVNNETGVVQPLAKIEVVVGPTRHLLFVDAAQAFGKLPLDFGSRATDMMAVSGHKIGAPVGIAALLLKGHCDTVRLIPGGGQESGRRGGTQSAALASAFGAAAEAFAIRFDAGQVSRLRDGLEAGLRALAPDLVVFGAGAERLAHVLDFAVPGVTSAVAMMGLDLAGVSVSSGSACSSGKVAPSHVLKAMGVPDEVAACALRVSLGWNSTAEDVEAFLGAFATVLDRQRRRHGVAA